MLQLGPCYPGGPSLKNSRKLPLSDLRAIFAYSLLDHPAMSRGFHTLTRTHPPYAAAEQTTKLNWEDSLRLDGRRGRPL